MSRLPVTAYRQQLRDVTNKAVSGIDAIAGVYPGARGDTEEAVADAVAECRALASRLVNELDAIAGRMRSGT